MVGKIITVLLATSLTLAIYYGQGDSASAALLEGASSAVTLVLSIGGGICLWSGVAEVMEQSGFAKIIAVPFQPIIQLIFGKKAKDEKFNEAMSQNITANFLGLGNLATPMGLKAAARLGKIADDRLVLRLIVMNTASIQLVPTTIAAVRLALGSPTPFDIMPAVIVSSALSVVAGLAMCVFMEKRWGNG